MPVLKTIRGGLTVLAAFLFDPSPGILLMEILYGFVLADFVLGSARAMIAHNWTITRFKMGVSKTCLWCVLVLLSWMLRRFNEFQDFDPGYAWILHHMGDLLIVYIVVVETISILHNISAINFLLGFRWEWLNRVIDIFERWGGDEFKTGGDDGANLKNGKHDQDRGGPDDPGRGADQTDDRSDAA